MTEQEIKNLNNEFSNEFDVLYNNITSNQAPGLDDYEKSVFLTKAQNEIIKAYFDPKSNKVQEGFDGSERRQIDFSMIVKTKEFTSFHFTVFSNHQNARSVTLDDDIMMLINETVTVERGDDAYASTLNVLPITYNEYPRLTSKPFRYPLKHQAWRILNSGNNGKEAEIIVGPNDTIIKYIIRYVKRPRAIILKDLGDLTIDGQSTTQCCELDPILFPEIIQRACELAKAAYVGDISTQIALGQASQTGIGVITQIR